MVTDCVNYDKNKFFIIVRICQAIPLVSLTRIAIGSDIKAVWLASLYFQAQFNVNYLLW